MCLLECQSNNLQIGENDLYQNKTNRVHNKTWLQTAILSTTILVPSHVVRSNSNRISFDSTHLPLDKMASIWQKIFSDAFSYMKTFAFWLQFHWSLFLRVQLRITQHWLRYIWWRLKSPASRLFTNRLFTQPFIQAQIKENIKAPRHWPLCGEFTGDRWKCFHLMTSSCVCTNLPLQQSTRFCSDNETSLPVALKCWPSRAPVEEKAQQEPHWPWGIMS